MERDDISGKKETFGKKFWSGRARRDTIMIRVRAWARGCILGTVRAVREG
jgi:hypothetical protein